MKWVSSMNVYDFDGTIYNGDSSVDFYRFSVKKNPYILLCIPKQAWGAMLYCIRKIDKTKLKEYFFSFLPKIDTAEMVDCFWEKHQHKIQKWYLAQRQPDDIIISASPEFLLRPVCNNIGITRLIASRVDYQNGKFDEPNCKGEEKVARLMREYSVSQIDSFYSDSISDQPLANISSKAFLVSKGEIKEWKLP